MIGKWLGEAGFNAGDKVEVTVEDNRLIIQKLVENNMSSDTKG